MPRSPVPSLRLPLLLTAVTLAWALPACDVNVHTTDGTTSDSSSTDSSASSQPSCTFGGPGLALDVTLPPGVEPVDVMACNVSNPPLPIQLDGTVHYVGGVLNVDTCPPNADCAPSDYAFQLTGPEYAVESDKIPAGTFVHVLWSYCDRGLVLRNLPSFGGVANPTATHESVWMVVVTGNELSRFADVEDHGLLLANVDDCVHSPSTTVHTSSNYALDVGAPDTAEHVTAFSQEKLALELLQGKNAGPYHVVNDGIGNSGMVFYKRSYAIYRQAP